MAITPVEEYVRFTEEGGFLSQQALAWVEDVTDMVNDGGGGGSTTPGGSDTQVQYNDGGAFGGISQFTYIDGSGAMIYSGTQFDINELSIQSNLFQYTGDTFRVNTFEIETDGYIESYPGTLSDGDVLQFIAANNRFEATALSTGNVSVSGSPLTDQIAVWDSASSIEGNASLTYDTPTGLMRTSAGIFFDDGAETVQLSHQELGIGAGFQLYLPAVSLNIRNSSAANVLRFQFDASSGDILATGDLDLGGYIIDYGGSPADGEVLTWVTTNNRAEFQAAGGGGGAFTLDSDESLFAGSGAGAALTTGADNFLAGNNAGNDLTIGSDNILIGENAGALLVSQTGNVGIGRNALSAVDPAAGTREHTAVGYQAASSITFSQRTVAIGFEAMRDATSFASGSIAIGHHAAASNRAQSVIAIGDGVLDNTGNSNNNVVIGNSAMTGGASSDGSRNNVIGNGSMPAWTTAAGNVVMGHNGALLLTTADQCVLIGEEIAAALTTGDNNTILGRRAGANISTGSGSVIIGHSAGPTANQSNELYIHNAQSNTPLIYGDFSGGQVSIHSGTTEVLRTDGDSTAGNTRFMIYDVDNAMLERVTVGAPDSGGTGFKVLRIPN